MQKPENRCYYSIFRLCILVLVKGLEPPLGCPKQILSLPRLPFRHTSKHVHYTPKTLGLQGLATK